MLFGKGAFGEFGKQPDTNTDADDDPEGFLNKPGNAKQDAGDDQGCDAATQLGVFTGDPVSDREIDAKEHGNE
jgi:hypothetical protein